MQTLKIKYSLNNPSDRDIILSYMKAYSSCLHYMFNRVKDSSLNELSCRKLYQSKQINNIDILSSWFVQSSIREAISLCSSLESRKSGSLIFGGRSLFKKRIKDQISKEEFRIKRLSPIYSIGTSGKTCVSKGNVKFYLNQDLKTVLFKPSRQIHIDLILPNLKPNYKKILSKLFVLQERKSIPISYKLDLDYIYIIFDEERLNEGFKQAKQIQDRVLGIDLNPNYIGWSVVDWKASSEDSYRLIKSGVITLKPLNDLETNFNVSSDNPVKVKLNCKRRHETLEIAKFLVETARHYRCQLFSVEDLSVKTGDRGMGRRFNRLVNNQWNRNILISSLNRRCDLYSIRFIKVRPEYSSFLGNILYRGLNLPDMILSSVEISRRAFEFYGQYISKERQKEKNIVFPERSGFEEAVSRSIEELNIADGPVSFTELYRHIKESKVRYRLSLDQFPDLEFSRFSSNSNKLVLHSYI